MGTVVGYWFVKKLLLIIVLGLLLSGNVFAKTGKGELKLSQTTMENLMLYMYGANNPKYSDGANKKNKPMLMAISADGKSSYYYYCPYPTCSDGNYVYKAIKKCEKKSNGSPCYLFATKRRIQWKNSINTKSTNIKKKLLKEPYQIAKIIQDLGFYDGDITELPGIDYNTAKLDNTIKITGKKDNYDYPSLIAKQKSVHKNDWKDYALDGNEKYKAWAMASTNTKNEMTFGWEADDTSWNDVIKKAFNRCNKYINQKPKNYPKNSICILYYKGTTPTTDKEKIETAKKYYSQREVENFFERYPYILNNSNNSLLKKPKITKKETQFDNDIVSKLKDLKDLLDSGVLTNEEFEKAKKKLLN